MSFKYINSAREQAPAIKDPMASYILLVLATHADAHGQCWPTHQLLTRETGLSIATVKRKLDLLRQQGRLQWTTNRKGGNDYRLIAQALSDQGGRADSSSSELSDSSPNTKTAAQIAHGSELSDSSSSELRIFKNPHRDRIPRESSLSRAHARRGEKQEGLPKEVNQAFEQFWAIYPKRVAKQAAQRAWDKAVKTATAEEIVNGARRYASERAGENQQYTKHPTTWLNGGCWMDEPGANVRREKGYAEMADDLRQENADEERPRG